MGRRGRKRGVNFPRPTASTTSRGYGTRHQAERRRWQPLVEAGVAVCVRCGVAIAPGTGWHLDYRDDKLGYLGPAHAECNLRAAGKRGNKLLREKQALERALSPPRRVSSREW